MNLVENMRQRANDPGARGLNFRFSRLIFTYWFTMGTMAYFVPFLKEIGMDSAQYGVVMSINSALGIIGPPLWGIITDKIRSIKKTFLVAFIASCAFLLLIPASGRIMVAGIALSAIILPINNFFLQPCSSLLDTWTIQAIAPHPTLQYGRIRLWGSLGYTLIGFIYSWLTGMMGTVTIVFYIFALPAALVLSFVLKEKDMLPSSGRALSFKDMQISRVFKSPYFCAFLLFLLFARIGLANGSTFLVEIVEANGWPRTMMGTMNAMRAAMEIPVMFFSGKIIKKIGPARTIMIAALLYGLDAFICSQAQSMGPIIVGTLIAGLAFGLFLPSMINYAAMLAPKGLETTSQTIVVALGFCANMLTSLIGGVMIKAFGPQTYYFFSAVLIIGITVVFFFSFAFIKKSTGKPRPDIS